MSIIKEVTRQELRKLRSVANYQFGMEAGEILFPPHVKAAYSKKTGRMRLIYRDNVLIATLRPNDGLIALTLAGAEALLRKLPHPTLRVVVKNEVSDYIKRGRNVFAKHVVEADPDLRPQDEVIVINQRGELLAVGKAHLSSGEMLSFKSGVAVRVRRGVVKSI
jgi:predicted RNA-binding protein (TIGR00451 family)